MPTTKDFQNVNCEDAEEVQKVRRVWNVADLNLDATEAILEWCWRYLLSAALIRIEQPKSYLGH